MVVTISSNKDTCGGKACIEGTRIRVIDVVERYKILRERPEDIASLFNIPIEAVFAALSYFNHNSGKMDV